MRDKPNLVEMDQVTEMSAAERLNYTLQCVIETEEVWGLGDRSGWILKELEDGTVCLPIWPFKEYTVEMNVNDWDDQGPLSVSLEHFIYKVLGMLKDEEMLVEVFPTQKSIGQIMSAIELTEMLEGMVDAGEYYMEG